MNYIYILAILKDNGVNYTEIDHEESHSCEDSKKFRQDKGFIGIGSKNIIFHCKGEFYLVVTHGDKQIKARNFKHEFGSKDIRFANQDEITRVIDAKIGSIPPFGFTNSKIKIYVDNEIFSNEFFIFNPSDPYKSVKISTIDLKKIFDNLENEVRYFIHEEEKFEILEKQ